MATPNYPNQMGMQPQAGNQHPPYPGMPAMGQPQAASPPPKPVRRGTSKAVPVVMSAGLAVGVFCGLLFGLGTGSEGAFASTAGPVGKSDDVPDVLKTPTAAAGTAKKIEAAPVPAPAPATAPVATGTVSGDGSGSAAGPGSAATPAVASGSAAPAATGSGGGSAAIAAAPAPAAADKTGKVKVEITPATAQAGAKITIDGKELTPDMAIALDASSGKKKVEIVVTQSGFHELKTKVELAAGDNTVKVELVKRSGGGAQPTGTPVAKNPSTPRPTWTGTQTVPAAPKNPPAQPKQPKQPRPPHAPAKGGLIDI